MDTVEFALERELSNSQFVNVVPRDRIEDALRLMRKPIDARIDATVGQEISLRDGGIHALLRPDPKSWVHDTCSRWRWWTQRMVQLSPA